VDYISIGALTKDCKAVDLSMRIAWYRLSSGIYLRSFWTS
jgi:hypothetical protein